MTTRAHRITTTYQDPTPEELFIHDWAQVLVKIESDELTANHGIQINGGAVLPLEVGESLSFLAAPGTVLKPVTDMGASTETVGAGPVLFAFIVTDLPIAQALGFLHQLVAGPDTEEVRRAGRDPEHSSMGPRRSRFTR